MATQRRKKSEEDITKPPGEEEAGDKQEGADKSTPKVTSLADKRRGPGRPAKADQLARAEAIVDKNQARLATWLAPFAPVASGTVIEYAQDNVAAVLSIAETHPQFLAKILMLEEIDAYLHLGTFVLALIVAIGVEMRMVSADGFVAGATGVSDVADKVEAERARRRKEREDYYDDGAAGANNENGQGERAPLPGLMGDIAVSPSD